MRVRARLYRTAITGSEGAPGSNRVIDALVKLPSPSGVTDVAIPLVMRCFGVAADVSSGTSCDPAAGVVCSLVARLACASGRCQPLGDGALGSRCAGNLVPFACTEGLTCRPTRALADSTCQEPAPPGGYCAASADCESFTCDLTDPLSPRCGSRACF